jgi:hypothetical protein
MARAKQADILAAKKLELSRSQQWRDHVDYDGTWRRMIDLYRGRHYDDKLKTDRIVVNMAFATINVIAPSVAVNNPKITLNARKADKAAQAVIAEQIINYTWRTNDFQSEFRSAVDDKLICGHGWLKIGYKYAQNTTAIPYDADTDEELKVEGAQEKDDPSVEINQVVTEDRPVLERVSLFDIFVDPDARNYKELRWICQRVKRPIADAKADKRYDAKARRDLQATMSSKWEKVKERPSHGEEPNSAKHGYVEVYEFWDIKARTVCTFTTAGERFLIATKPSPFPFDHPFHMLRNYDVPDEFYPMGELEAIEVLQHELNQTRTQMLNHRKKFSRKWLFHEPSFKQDGMDALESEEDNVMVPVVGDIPLDRVVMAMPASITPPEFYNQSSMIQEDINLVSATSEYTRGSMPDIRRTATEAAMIQDSQNARSADKLSRIETELSVLAEKLLQVLQTFLTGEHVVRIVGEDGAPRWATYDRDYIDGNFDFEVQAGSTQPMNETFRRQSAMQLVDAMAPFAEVLNMPELAKHLLTEGFGIKQAEKFIMLPPDPQAAGGPPGPGQMPQGMPPGMPQQGGIPAA